MFDQTSQGTGAGAPAPGGTGQPPAGPQPAGTGQPPPGQPPEAAAPEQPGKPEAATPQEQDAYNRTVIAGMRIIYGEASHKKVMAMLKKLKDDPISALVGTTLLVIEQLDHAANKKIPRQVILKASIELLALVAELAWKAGFIEPSKQVITSAGNKLAYEVSRSFAMRDRGKPKAAPVDGKQAAPAPTPAAGSPPTATGAAPNAAPPQQGPGLINMQTGGQ